MAETDTVELHRALKGASFPTDRDHLTEVARKNGADDRIVEKISHLDERNFDALDKVEKAFSRSA